MLALLRPTSFVHSCDADFAALVDLSASPFRLLISRCLFGLLRLQVSRCFHKLLRLLLRFLRWIAASSAFDHRGLCLDRCVQDALCHREWCSAHLLGAPTSRCLIAFWGCDAVSPQHGCCGCLLWHLVGACRCWRCWLLWCCRQLRVLTSLLASCFSRCALPVACCPERCVFCCRVPRRVRQVVGEFRCCRLRCR